MAEDKNKDQDPEEDKFEDDEDFGLPDLEYDELDDENDVLDEEEITEEPVAAEDNIQEEPESSSQEPSGGNDEASEREEDWEKELESELDSEMSAGGTIDDTPDYYEEESFEEFEEESVSSSVFDSDAADSGTGPTDIDPPKKETPASPPPRKEPEPARYVPPRPQYAPSYSSNSNNGSKSGFTRIVIIGTILFITAGIVFVILWNNSGLEDPKPVAHKEVKKPVQEKEPTPVQKEEEKKPVPEKQPEQTPQPIAKKPGEIITLEQRTGRSYVVIGSFFDGDLAMDYAKELAADGNSPMIIPPFRDYRFYRVAIAEFENFKAAESNVAVYQEQFSTQAWPLRY